MKKLDIKIYCSLDIETSGFDPLINEILEVGFAFFSLDEKGVKITEEFTQVFKPSKPVGPQILGLTGMSQKELDEAPAFSDFKEQLQEKLGKAIIVGHNINFDIKFLESSGIKFSGGSIDTLDLVQWLLPTHHSYNLENLMHYFGISHKEAHRALADSKATITLLEKLLEVFNAFPDELKKEILGLLKPQEFLWKDFFYLNFSKWPTLKAKSNKQSKVISIANKSSFDFAANKIYNFPLANKFTSAVALGLKSKSTKSKAKNSLIVVPKNQQALDLYNQGLANGILVLSDLKFNEKNFAKIVKRKNLIPEEFRFVLKILVWQKTNWQNETILDLNLSFFGGQFKALVTGGEVSEDKTAQVLVCDQNTFLQLSSLGLCKDRQIVICGLSEFESAVTTNIGAKASWGYIAYLLKSFYNLELNTGKEEFKKPVEDALLAGDLFFGLINALLQTDPPSFQYYKVSSDIEYTENFQKIKGAAQSYVEKLKNLNLIFKSDGVVDFIKSVESFFATEDNKVKWIELAEKRCALMSMPIDIKDLVSGLIKPFATLSFADSFGSNTLPNFFAQRLGLTDFSVVGSVEGKVLKPSKPKTNQGDLFAGIKKAFGSKKPKVVYHVLPHGASTEELLKLIGKDSTFPAAILFPNPLQIKEFYEQNYQELKQRVSLLAQSHSGGSNKLFRNFGIKPNSLLLATDKLILKSMSGASQVQQVEQLSVKTLILCRLPFEQFSHPYQEAISKAMPNAFMDYALPRALYNFDSLLRFFYGPELKDIYIIDAKLAKEYASVFKDYYKLIPNAELDV